jgi:hypothetical protein
MKREARVRGELHANDLVAAQIEDVLGVLGHNRNAVAVSVVCGNATPFERWARREIREPDLWAELHVESCMPLLVPEMRSIHPDAGRTRKPS